MASIPKDPFIIVDGSAYLFRAYHALPPLTNAKGMPTGAIYGVVNMIRNLKDEYKSKYFTVVFDAPGGNFRHEIFPEYKANRGEMPEDLAEQIPYVIDVIKKMGITVITVPGIEADDIIATMVDKAEKAGLFTVISSGDKDLAQLVNEKTVLVNTMTNTVMDIAGVEEKFQVKPSQIIDYLALVGDSVDNIPGVNKVGPKTAVKWLQEHGTLDNIVNNAYSVKGKVGENLRAAIEDIPLYVRLVSLVKDVDIEYKIDDTELKEPDNEELYTLFKELEFKKWLAELKSLGYGGAAKKINAEVVTPGSLAQVIATLKDSEIIAFDVETTSLEYIKAELIGLSLSVKDNSYYFPIAHDYDGVGEQIDLDIVIDLLEELFSDKNRTAVAHNIKYDAGVLANYGIKVNTKIFDTMLASYVYDSTAGKHDLSSVATRCLELETSSYEDLVGKGAKQIPFSQVKVEDACKYCCEDSHVSYALYEFFKPKLAEVEGLSRIFNEVEMPLVNVLLNMERYGVLVDSEMLNKQSEEIAVELEQLEEKAFAIAGGEFNLGSPKQLQEILFDKLGLPVISKTPKGAPSTAEPVLIELAKAYELPAIILSSRSLSKLKSTYTDSLPRKVFAKTGRIHTSYHQAVTSTGRLSSTDPNLQNIPIKTPEGRRVREAFIAPEGFVIMSADYSQIELRIMAHLSKDEQLLSAFANGLDVHRSTAAEVFEVELDEVSDQQRRHAKAINFGLIYGMSAFGLSQQLSIERGLAQDYIDSYFAKFPKVQKFMDRTRDFAHMHGFVETLLGRRLYLPDIASSNAIKRKAAERAAINAPMQGGQADIIKIAMAKIDATLKNDVNCKLIMQVHDELVFEVKEDMVDSYSDMVKAEMAGAASLDVELLVEVGVGKSWDDAH